MSDEKILSIKAIKLKEGYFLTDNLFPQRYHNGTPLAKLRINGEFPEKTFHANWVYSYSKPLCVESKVYGKFINKRYELIDPDMASDHIPLTLPKDEVVECCDYSCEWKKEYAHLKSLYEYKEDKEEDRWETVPFELDIILEVDTYFSGATFSFPIQRTEWSYEGFTTCTEKNIVHQDFDKIMWPSPLLEQRPSKLSSKDTYKIIRKHVQDNIDPKIAVITSDYNSCFTVKKKVNKENNPYRKDRLITIFEMTNKEDKYKGYTPIEGFRGESHEDLKNNINKYLEELMSKINEPLVECPHCKGQGVLFK